MPSAETGAVPAYAAAIQPIFNRRCIACHGCLGSPCNVKLKQRYAVLRNSEHFWPFYDWLNTWNFNERGDDAGWLDLSYYDAPRRRYGTIERLFSEAMGIDAPGQKALRDPYLGNT